MGLIRNLLALIGLVVVAALIWAAVQYGPLLSQVRELDERAPQVYAEMFQKILETGNSADATVWKRKVQEGLSVEDVETSLVNVANELNIQNVGRAIPNEGGLPLSKQVEASSGKPYRFVKIYMFCNALTAAKMLDYSDAYSAYLPCRISLVEDKTGQLWLYTLNMDLMIYGGKPLPPDLKAEAERVKEVLLEIMDRAAEGDF
jgi:hypothetical protein